MSPETLFIIALLIGACFIYVGKKIAEKIKFLLIIMGILFVAFGGFGMFTSFL